MVVYILDKENKKEIQEQIRADVIYEAFNYDTLLLEYTKTLFHIEQEDLNVI